MFERELHKRCRLHPPDRGGRKPKRKPSGLGSDAEVAGSVAWVQGFSRAGASDTGLTREKRYGLTAARHHSPPATSYILSHRYILSRADPLRYSHPYVGPLNSCVGPVYEFLLLPSHPHEH
jgi:hypothetical protein